MDSKLEMDNYIEGFVKGKIIKINSIVMKGTSVRTFLMRL